MSSDALDGMLERLNAGDAETAERFFVAYEPYLRIVVRRRLSPALRTKFDSMDIVQSVWVDILGGLRDGKWEFKDAQQLRAFLVKMTRNRLIDRFRHHHGTIARESQAPDPGIDAMATARAARVSEEFYADELWQQMIDACPPAHYELLMLKRQGATIAEIAAQTQLHKSSVRRILYDLARRVARLRTPIEPGPR